MTMSIKLDWNNNQTSWFTPVKQIGKFGSHLFSTYFQVITSDNLVKVMIAASTVIGGSVIAQANSHEEMLDGISIAGTSIAIFCLLSGVACALKGKTHQAANRLGIALLFAGISKVATMSKSSNQIVKTLDSCVRVHTCSASEIALPFLDRSKAMCDRTGINSANLLKLEILERPLGIADQQLLQYVSQERLMEIKGAYDHPTKCRMYINKAFLPILLKKILWV